jgi:hypothetical protein
MARSRARSRRGGCVHSPDAFRRVEVGRRSPRSAG